MSHLETQIRGQIMKKALEALVLAAVLVSRPVVADDSFSSQIFVDGYLAGSANNPPQPERPYFTQASRNNQGRINLVSAGLGFDDQRYRAKIVGQFGDSVDLNYAAEPQEAFRYLQEGYFGIYLDKDTTIDVGAFFAHIGAESWLSKDNPTYTRSFIAEYSPYYESGVRLSHRFSSQWSGQALLLNGWQNISDNRHPALGTQLRWENSGLAITSNTFLGGESNGTRAFHDLIVSQAFDGGSSISASIDVGYQSSASISSGWWWGYALIGRIPVLATLSFSTRFESYQDPDAVIVTSVTGQPFRAYGASVGADVQLAEGVLARGEVKQLMSPERIFPDKQNSEYNDTLFVVSLSFSDQCTF